MDVIDALKWRSATKKFDTAKKVSNEDLEKLLEAGNLTATSGGLQPVKMVVVSDSTMLQDLVQDSYGQTQVGEASHLLVFAYETKIDESIVDRFIERAADVRNVSTDDLAGYSQSMKGYVQSMDEETRLKWARNQAYILLGTVITVAAEMKIDTCPMEGFDPIQYQEKLGLKEKGLMPAVVLPIGYRAEEDWISKVTKVRMKREDFVVELN